MLERSSIGVLGVLAAGLSLAALATQPRAGPPAGLEPARAPSAPPASARRTLREGERIDVNRARAEDLELLPGVGPALARRILEHRTARGPFTAPEALLGVRGIGPRTLERLRPLITCEPPPPATTAAAEPTQPSNTNRIEAAIAK